MHERVVFSFGEFKSRKCYGISFSRDYTSQGQKNKKALKNQGFSWLYLFYSPYLVAEVGFFIALHRRIVVCRRLDASLTLGSAYSLRLAVSLRQKQHSVVFALLPTTSSVGREAQTSFPQPTKKDTKRCPFRWLRRWDLNLTTSGL